MEIVIFLLWINSVIVKIKNEKKLQSEPLINTNS